MLPVKGSNKKLHMDNFYHFSSPELLLGGDIYHAVVAQGDHHIGLVIDEAHCIKMVNYNL